MKYMAIRWNNLIRICNCNHSPWIAFLWKECCTWSGKMPIVIKMKTYERVIFRRSGVIKMFISSAQIIKCITRTWIGFTDWKVPKSREFVDCSVAYLGWIACCVISQSCKSIVWIYCRGTIRYQRTFERYFCSWGITCVRFYPIIKLCLLWICKIDIAAIRIYFTLSHQILCIQNQSKLIIILRKAVVEYFDYSFVA